MLADHVTGSGLLHRQLTLQQGEALAQFLLTLFFRTFLQFLLIGIETFLQNVLHLAQMFIGLTSGLGQHRPHQACHQDHSPPGAASSSAQAPAEMARNGT